MLLAILFKYELTILTRLKSHMFIEHAEKCTEETRTPVPLLGTASLRVLAERRGTGGIPFPGLAALAERRSVQEPGALFTPKRC